MYERVLIPLDGSELAESVFPEVRPILRACRSEVILDQVVGYPVGRCGDPAIIAKAYGYLQETEKELATSDIRSRSLVSIGTPAEAILADAAREQANLIAITTHGRTGFSKMLFGSVALEVMRSSPVPVFLVRAIRPAIDRTIRKILVPLDGSGVSFNAVPHSLSLARVLEARVTLLHVFENQPTGTELLPPAHPLDPGVLAFERAGLPISCDFRSGTPAKEIVSVCEEGGFDLIVMTTHGRTGIARWVLGSVTEEVVRHAPVPVLAVRAAGC